MSSAPPSARHHWLTSAPHIYTSVQRRPARHCSDQECRRTVWIRNVIGSTLLPKTLSTEESREKSDDSSTFTVLGAIQVLRNAVGVGCQLSRKKRYEVVQFNVISVTRGLVGVKFPGKKRYLNGPLADALK